MKVKYLLIVPAASTIASFAMPLASCYVSPEKFETKLNISLGSSFLEFTSIEPKTIDSGLNIQIEKTGEQSHITTDVKYDQLISKEIISDSQMLKNSLTFSEDGKKLYFDGMLLPNTYTFKLAGSYKDFTEDPKDGKIIHGQSNDITLIINQPFTEDVEVNIDNDKYEGDSITVGESDPISVKFEQEDVTNNVKLSVVLTTPNSINDEELIYVGDDHKIHWKQGLSGGTYEFFVCVQPKDEALEEIKAWSRLITLTIEGPVLYSQSMDLNQPIVGETTDHHIKYKMLLLDISVKVKNTDVGFAGLEDYWNTFYSGEESQDSWWIEIIIKQHLGKCCLWIDGYNNDYQKHPIIQITPILTYHFNEPDVTTTIKLPLTFE